MATKLTTYDTVGIKEDVSDIISRISPEETPFTSSLKKEKIHSTIHSFLENVLKAQDLTNSAPQGAEYADQELNQPVTRQTNTQIMRKVINVAETVEATDRYGRAKEAAWQMEMRAAELKIDKEGIYLSGQKADIGTTSAGAKTPSFQAQVDANLLIATGGASTSPTAALVTKTLQTLKQGGSKANTIMLPFSEAGVPATWAAGTSISNVRQVPNSGDAASMVQDYVDVFVTAVGRLDVILNINAPLATDYFVYNPKDHVDCVLRPWTRIELAKTGDADRMAIRGEYAYKNVNSKSSAVIRKTAGTAGKFTL